jgi:hypothetical protein
MKGITLSAMKIASRSRNADKFPALESAYGEALATFSVIRPQATGAVEGQDPFLGRQKSTGCRGGERGAARP